MDRLDSEMNNKRIGLLNKSQLESYLKEKELTESYFIDWKHKHPTAYKMLNDVLEDSVFLNVIAKYLAIQFMQVDKLTTADKVILKLFAHLDLVDVLVDEKSVEEKHIALAKWEATLLEIVGNNSVEILKIGRTAGSTKVRINENPKIQAYKEREAILKKGRAKGSKSQKDYAAETKQLIEAINSDLLKHSDTARWKLDKRASYIEKKLKENNRKQINGQPYKVSTIKLLITGKE